MCLYLQPFFATKPSANAMKPDPIHQPDALRLALIGYPIAHSLSPSLFQAYCPYDLLETSSFQEGFHLFITGNYWATNVTTPFKEEAYTYADQASPICHLLKATNLLIKEKDGVHAYNTDYSAVCQLLRQHICRPQHILVIGCGGAGKAAASAVYTEGHHLYLANRNTQKASDFIQALQSANLPISTHNPSEKRICKPLSLDHIPAIWEQINCVIITLPAAFNDSRFAKILLEQDYTDKLVIEANYAAPLLKNAPQYLGGRLWLKAQAQPLIERISRVVQRDPNPTLDVSERI